MLERCRIQSPGCQSMSRRTAFVPVVAFAIYDVHFGVNGLNSEQPPSPQGDLPERARPRRH